MLYTPTFFAMAFANLACLCSFSIFYLFPLFITDHHGDQVDIGIVMGAFALASVLCRPWISDMIDRIGRKKSYGIGSLLMTLLPLTYLLFRGDLGSFYLPLIVVRIFHGVAFAICITAAFTYMADIIPKDRLNEGLGMFGVSGLVGSAVGPVIAELVIDRAGFGLLFPVASATALLGLMVHFPLKETYVHVLRTTESSFFLVLQRRRVLTVAVIALLFGFSLAAVNGFIAPFASERRIAFISLYYIAYSSAAILVRFLGGSLVDRLGENRIIPYALFLICSGLFLLIFMQGSGLLFLSGFMTGCGHGLLYPALNTLAIRGESHTVRGKITGAFTGSIDAGSFVGSVLLGYVGDLAGFPWLFLLSAFSVFSAIFIFRFDLARRGTKI